MNLKHLVVLTTVCLVVSACCDRKTRRIQPFWMRAGDSYLLLPDSISESGNRLAIKGRSVIHAWFANERIAGDVSAHGYGFWLDLTNRSGDPIRLLWPEARYVDELGKAHELFHQPLAALADVDEMGPTPAVILPSGYRIHEVILPRYKSYVIAYNCRDYTDFREPLVPTTLIGRDEIGTKYYVKDLAVRQVPVKFILPIEAGGKRLDYAFSFVLKKS